MKKIDSKQVFAGVAVAGVLLLVCFYVLFYMKYDERISQLKQENSTLQNRVMVLTTYNQKAADFKKEMDSMRQGIERILEEYPANALEEDAIMLAVEMQESGDIQYDAINIGTDVELYGIQDAKVVNAGVPGLSKGLSFVEKAVTYSNKISYGSLKDCIAKIYDSKNKIAISNIVYVSEGSGGLKGSIDISFYSVRGTDKEYVKPDIAEYMAGKADLFQ